MSKKKTGIILASILIILVIALVAICSPEQTELPSMTNEEQSYISALQDNSITVSNAFEELSTLMNNPQIGVDEWTIKAATQLTIIRFAYDEVKELNPPTSLSHIHSKYNQAMSKYSEATYLIASGIDNLDSALLDEATIKMEEGAQYINEVTALLQTFMANHR